MPSRHYNKEEEEGGPPTYKEEWRWCKGKMNWKMILKTIKE